MDNPIQATGREKTTIKAVIIRKDGTREELGTVYGGNPIQKVASYLRIKLANLKHKWRNS